MFKMSAKLARAFRANVRGLMDEAGMTQSQLSEKLGVTPSFVSQMLSGHRDPGLDSLEQFAKVLGVKAADLLQEKILAKSA